MINLNHEVRSLLFEHDYVTIPDFGAFIAHYEPSEYSFEKNTFSPPNRKISFNGVLKQDDGLLISAIIKKSGTSVNSSKELLSAYVKKIKTELVEYNIYKFENLGSLHLNQDNKITFEPELTNFFNEGFGFDTFYNFKNSNFNVKSIIDSYSNSGDSQIETMEIDLNSIRNRKSNYTKFLYALPVIVLIGGLITVIALNPLNDKRAKSSLNPIDYVDSASKWFEIVKPNPVVPSTQQNSEIIEVVQPTYHILIGEFNKTEKATILYNKLVLNDISPKIITENNKTNVIIEVATEEEAQIIAEKLKQLFGQKGVLVKK